MFKSQSLTLSYDGRAREIKSVVSIFPAFDPETASKPFPDGSRFLAIWDTGATGSVITKKVVDACGLQPISLTTIHTAHGVHNNIPEHLINMRFPKFEIGFVSIRAAEVDMSGDADVLIGMDIIALGDFSITNVDDKTVFSFRAPSIAPIDYVKQHFDKSNIDGKIGRNAQCPCNSGKKYKNCHGP